MKLGTVGFVGARLREGREARGFTAAALAVPLQVTPAAITQYEKSIQTPRPEVMDRAMATLQLPMAFFLRKVSREEGVVYWRSLASSTRLAQMVGERRLGWVQDIASLLREHLDLPALHLPNFDLPRDPLALSDELIERIASETRKAWGIGDGPLPNITRILEERGVILARDDLGAATLDALSKWCPEENGAYCLVSSGKVSTARARLSVLHELGHVVLHRHLDRWHLVNPRLHHLIEDQAFKFAGAFALPGESFAADLYSLSLDSFVSLKAKWKFAVGMMLKRCEALGIGKDETIQRLWRSLSSRGWRLNEPLDDEIPPEHPMLLADGIRFLIDQNLLSGEQIWYGCGLAAKDIEELANLPPGAIDPAARGKVTMLPWQHEAATPRTTTSKAKLLSFPGRKVG
jgi:Zn-dependent peptidase ImmA (M78 family)/transcriptional regulator with XRE-family HTH domain